MKPEDVWHTYTTFKNGPPGTEHSYYDVVDFVPKVHQHEFETDKNSVPVEHEYSTTLYEIPLKKTVTTTAVNSKGVDVASTYTITDYEIPVSHTITETVTNNGIPTIIDVTTSTIEEPITQTFTSTTIDTSG